MINFKFSNFKFSNFKFSNTHFRIFTLSCVYFPSCLFESQWNVDIDKTKV